MIMNICATCEYIQNSHNKNKCLSLVSISNCSLHNSEGSCLSHLLEVWISFELNYVPKFLIMNTAESFHLEYNIWSYTSAKYLKTKYLGIAWKLLDNQ